MSGELAPDRRVLALTGKDVAAFLQGLVSNDIRPLEKADGVVWAALLTPQGKYLADFFVVRRGADWLLDIAAGLAEPTIRRLMMYRLRADVQIAPLDLVVTRGLGPAPAGAMADPRHPALGWRNWGSGEGAGAPSIGWDAIRVAHLIPESGVELVPDDSYLLETGFERLNGVDFRKGCYVGQEVTARMKHKTELRKGLARLVLDGPAPPGTPVTLPDGREAGRLGTVAGNRALAFLRFDRMNNPLYAGTVAARPE